MRSDDRVRLQHMLDASKFALRYLDVGRDNLTIEAIFTIVYSIQAVGEAAAKMSREMRDATPHIPWRDIRDMRNRLVHQYFDVDVEVVWNALANNVPNLVAQLEELLQQAGE